MRLLRRAREAPADLTVRPVRYREIAMRSSTEARWCVFLDALGIPWEYEPGAVNVRGRNRFVDFWLPSLGCYLEVKPALTPIDEALAEAIAMQKGSPLIWLSGSPRPGEYEITLSALASEPPRTKLRWAVGRTNHAQVWLIDVGKAWAIRLTPSTVPLEWEAGTSALHPPLFDCHVLRAAYRQAMCWQFSD